MSQQLTGSDLTRVMLARGDKEVWCAVGDENDAETMSDQNDHDFKARIVSFDDGKFCCTGGMEWSFAVPIKISPLTSEEAGF